MAITCCDTSFLFSIYGKDVFTPVALAKLATQTGPILITVISTFEMENAFHLSEFRKLYPSGTTDRSLAAMQLDLSSNTLKFRQTNLALVFSEAKRLSAKFTSKNGHRSCDILHVASALCCKATEFLTFDKNQKQLAESEGLIVPF